MAEEIRNASTVLPRAIIISIVLNGVLGFAILIAYLFCLGDLEAVLESQATLGYPFLFVFQKGVRSDPGAAVMGLLIVTLGICATVGVVASSSRMLWSFARDRGVPIWKTFVKVRCLSLSITSPIKPPLIMQTPYGILNVATLSLNAALPFRFTPLLSQHSSLSFCLLSLLAPVWLSTTLST